MSVKDVNHQTATCIPQYLIKVIYKGLTLNRKYEIKKIQVGVFSLTRAIKINV